jgi:uridine kinase
MTDGTRPLIVGIAGGTGSGKTTVARAIAEALGSERCAVIDHDAYYHDLAHLPFAQRVGTNFDHPLSLDNERLCHDLDALRSGTAVEKPVYDFTTHTRASQTVRIEPRRVVLVEGILVLAHAGLRERMDIRIFVDTDADVRLMRRVRRDMEERGRSFEDIREQYYRTVRPMHLAHVEPSRRHAHLVLPEGGENRVAVGLVVRALVDASAH